MFFSRYLHIFACDDSIPGSTTFLKHRINIQNSACIVWLQALIFNEPIRNNTNRFKND